MTISSAFDFFLLRPRGTGSSSRIVVVIRVRFAITFAPWGKRQAIETLSFAHLARQDLVKICQL
jgi:hypothetical protein